MASLGWTAHQREKTLVTVAAPSRGVFPVMALLCVCFGGFDSFSFVCAPHHYRISLRLEFGSLRRRLDIQKGELITLRCEFIVSARK